MDLKKIPQFKAHPDAALDFYRSFGFHVEYDVWSLEQCADLRRQATRCGSYSANTLSPLMQPHRENAAFLSAMKHQPVVSIVEKLVGGNVSALQTEFFFCKPGTYGFAKHQDNFYVEAGKDMFASAWCPLEAVDEGNGTLVVYPGTHREPILPVKKIESTHADMGQDPNAFREELVLPEGYAPLALSVPAGSAVYIHAHLVHESLRNRSEHRTRNVLLMTYIRQGQRFRPGGRAKREEVDVYT